TEFQSVYRDIHELVLARSSAGKLARLLLSWTRPEGEKTESESRVPSSLTHEEMAQMIGASRETVTRLLGDLKKKELIRVDGSTLPGTIAGFRVRSCRHCGRGDQFPGRL